MGVRSKVSVRMYVQQKLHKMLFLSCCHFPSGYFALGQKNMPFIFCSGALTRRDFSFETSEAKMNEFQTPSRVSFKDHDVLLCHQVVLAQILAISVLACFGFLSCSHRPLRSQIPNTDYSSSAIMQQKMSLTERRKNSTYITLNDCKYREKLRKSTF